MKRVIIRLVAVVFVLSTIVASLCLSVGAAYTAQDFIYEAMSQRKEKVDLGGAGVSNSSGHFYDVYYSNPQFFYYSNAYSYSTIGSSSTINTLFFKFTMPSDEIDGAISEYNSMLSDILSAMPGGLNNVGKVIWIHEYIVSAYMYDYTYYTYDAYNLMKEGSGVCDAYSMLMIALLKSQGIECCYRYSRQANHSWVIVKLDGQWYNVDATWDDPSHYAGDNTSEFTYSEGCHEYLLVSDAAMMARDGNALRADANSYCKDVSCTSIKYDNAFWKDVEGLMVTLNGKWYYIDESQYGKDGKALVENSVTQGETKRISIHTDYWRPQENPNAYYKGTYSGIGVYNGQIFVNSPKDVLSVNPSTGLLTVVYTLNSNNRIYRTEIVPGSKIITLYVDDEPYSGEYEVKQLDLSALVGAGPTATPTARPTATPTARPTATPTARPTATPTARPTTTPTAGPTTTPTAGPTATPTAEPTATTPETTTEPTAEPAVTPVVTPVTTPAAPPAETGKVPGSTPTTVPTTVPAGTSAPVATPEMMQTTAEPNDRVTDGRTDVPQNDWQDGLILVSIVGISALTIAIAIVIVKNAKPKTT